jgi:ribosomal protein S18 acetylase RimI-like enzyme
MTAPRWHSALSHRRQSRRVSRERAGYRGMAPSIRFAAEADIPAILKLRLAVDADLAQRFGKNRWSTTISEKSVTRGLRSSKILVASRHGQIVGALRMETKKPWAVDLRYFTPVRKAVYLHDVNVDPRLQRSGVGRRLIDMPLVYFEFVLHSGLSARDAYG